MASILGSSERQLIRDWWPSDHRLGRWCEFWMVFLDIHVAGVEKDMWKASVKFTITVAAEILGLVHTTVSVFFCYDAGRCFAVMVSTNKLLSLQPGPHASHSPPQPPSKRQRVLASPRSAMTPGGQSNPFSHSPSSMDTIMEAAETDYQPRVGNRPVCGVFSIFQFDFQPKRKKTKS